MAAKLVPGKDNRCSQRHRTGIQAWVIDPGNDKEYSCLILDATRNGCRIFCDCIEDVPDDVRLLPDGLKQPIDAKIRWRKNMLAGMSINWGGAPPS